MGVSDQIDVPSTIASEKRFHDLITLVLMAPEPLYLSKKIVSAQRRRSLTRLQDLCSRRQKSLRETFRKLQVSNMKAITSYVPATYIHIYKKVNNARVNVWRVQ